MPSRPPPLDGKAAADLSRRHRALAREVVRITGVLNETLTEIRLNDLGSPESNDLMDRTVLTPLQRTWPMGSANLSAETSALWDGLIPATGQKHRHSQAPRAAVDRQDQIAAAMRIVLKQMSQWDSFRWTSSISIDGDH